MRAQKVEDPSMEDILSSIRKIISEDGKEDATSASGEDSRASNQERPQDTTNHATPQPRQQPVPPQQNVNRDAAAQQSPQPVVLSERREHLDTDSIPRQERRPTPDHQSSSPVEPVFAEKPNPMIRPAVHTPPVQVSKTSEKSAGQNAPVNAANLQQPNQKGSGRVPGFVETKPPMDNSDENSGIPERETETPLHPAITNAKSFVSIQGSAKNSEAESIPKGNETPVFANPQSSANIPMEKLISPDNADRRDVDERRNHPLRRGVDRVESEVRNELMSPSTTESVHTAFEQLKSATTENLNGNVQEMIRPMLREWLDNNLPSMVERLVRDEIERVSRGE